MNRHSRRSSVRSIRHSDLITHLIAADVPLDDQRDIAQRGHALVRQHRGQEANLHRLQDIVRRR